MFGLNNWETYEDINELHKARACKENLKIITLENPSEVDEHNIHITEHTKFIISDSGEKEDKTFINNLIKHIKQHKEKLLLNKE